MAAPRILRPTRLNLVRAASMLRLGGIVGVPSETVYGLAADALNAEACAKIFTAKGRPSTDPLIVHLASADELPGVAAPNDASLRLARACWPGPLTLVLPKLSVVPDAITAGRPTVAVRVPGHAVFRELIRLAGRPLAAPSANPFGYVSPTCAAHVRDGLRDSGLRLIVDGGECEIGVESTIIDLTEPERPRLLRPGGLAVEEVERILGRAVLRLAARGGVVAAGVAAPAPGMLAQHYSPRTALTLIERLTPSFAAELGPRSALLFLRRPDDARARRGKKRDARVHWLSEAGELEEIARNLFARLRELDAGGWERIYAEMPEGAAGLAPAIRDRLTRAAARG